MVKNTNIQEIIAKKFDDFAESMLKDAESDDEKVIILETLEEAAYTKLHKTITLNLKQIKQGVTL